MGRLPGLHSLGLPSSRFVFVLRVSGILVRLVPPPHTHLMLASIRGNADESERDRRKARRLPLVVSPDSPADAKRRTKTRLCF